MANYLKASFVTCASLEYRTRNGILQAAYTTRRSAASKLRCKLLSMRWLPQILRMLSRSKLVGIGQQLLLLNLRIAWQCITTRSTRKKRKTLVRGSCARCTRFYRKNLTIDELPLDVSRLEYEYVSGYSRKSWRLLDKCVMCLVVFTVYFVYFHKDYI